MDEQIDSRERPLVAAVLAELKVAASLLMPKLKKRYEHRTPNKAFSEVGFQQDLKQKALLGAPYTHVPECFPTSSLVALLISLLSLVLLPAVCDHAPLAMQRRLLPVLPQEPDI